MPGTSPQLLLCALLLGLAMPGCSTDIGMDQPQPAKGNGSLQTIQINEPKAVKLEVKLVKSGAVDNLRLCP